MTDDLRFQRHLGRRAAAIAAVVVLVLVPVVAGAGLYHHFDLIPQVWCALGVAAAGAWWAISRHGARRVIGSIACLAGLVLVVVIFDLEDRLVWFEVDLVLLVLALGLARVALAHTRGALRNAPKTGKPVSAAAHGVLIMNPTSGGGKVDQFDLEADARRRGIEPIVLRPGDDLLDIATDAVKRGADVIGMAGGDGSQALVASVAAKFGVAHVCVPAGTRNHFALDLGLDRRNVVGALDAFGDGAIERRVDLARVGDRVFVNNASLGVYAEIVQSADYRNDKIGTAAARLPDLLGPRAARPGLAFTGPDGTRHETADLILVSNNPYELARLGGAGSRPTLDTGSLGILALHVRGAAEMAELVSLEAIGAIRRFRGWLEWTAPSFEIEADGLIEVGVDGEALQLPSPLTFTTLPGALRVRIPQHAPGSSPSAVALHFTSRRDLGNLARVALGKTAKPATPKRPTEASRP